MVRYLIPSHVVKEKHVCLKLSYQLVFNSCALWQFIRNLQIRVTVAAIAAVVWVGVIVVVVVVIVVVAELFSLYNDVLSE